MKNKRVAMSKPIPVKMDAALLERIQALADRLGEPKSTIMRMAMRAGLENLEKAFEAQPLQPGLYPPHQAQFSTAEEPQTSSALRAVEKEAIRAFSQRFPRRARPPKADPPAKAAPPK